MKIKEENREEAISYLNDAVSGVQNIIKLIENDEEIDNEDWLKCANPMIHYIKIYYDTMGWNFYYPMPEDC